MALSQGRTRGPHRLAVPLPRSRARVRHLLVSFSHSRTLGRRGEAIYTSASKIRSSMSTPERFAELVQTFFCDYLIKQRDLSPRTVSAYRDTFRLLSNYLKRPCAKRPDQLMLSNLTAAQLIAFLEYLEEERGNCVRPRNLRLAALRSFFRYVGACEGPEMIAQTQRIMAIPLKRFARPLLGFLSQSEMQALLQAMDNSWSGRRDHLLFLFLYNTGARVSEALSVRVQDVQRHDYRSVQLLGKGRKQRTVPLWKETVQHIRAC